MEYISLIMLLLWGWGIWSFITLRRKSRKIASVDNNRTSVDTFDDMRTSLRYSDWPCNIHYSNKD